MNDIDGKAYLHVTTRGNDVALMVGKSPGDRPSRSGLIVVPYFRRYGYGLPSLEREIAAMIAYLYGRGEDGLFSGYVDLPAIGNPMPLFEPLDEGDPKRASRCYEEAESQYGRSGRCHFRRYFPVALLDLRILSQFQLDPLSIVFEHDRYGGSVIFPDNGFVAYNVDAERFKKCVETTCHRLDIELIWPSDALAKFAGDYDDWVHLGE